MHKISQNVDISGQIRLIWRYLGFLTLVTFLLIYLHFPSNEKISLIKSNNLIDQSSLHHLSLFQTCEETFKSINKLHSSVGKSNPNDQQALVAKQNKLSIKNEWILDHEWTEIQQKKSTPKLVVTNKDIQSITERIRKNLEYNSFGDFNLEKVKFKKIFMFFKS